MKKYQGIIGSSLYWKQFQNPFMLASSRNVESLVESFQDPHFMASFRLAVPQKLFSKHIRVSFEYKKAVFLNMI